MLVGNDRRNIFFVWGGGEINKFFYIISFQKAMNFFGGVLIAFNLINFENLIILPLLDFDIEFRFPDDFFFFLQNASDIIRAIFTNFEIVKNKISVKKNFFN